MPPRPFAHRPAAPRCRGGASSLLRLSATAGSRWPSATALGDWAGRIAHQAALAPDTTAAPLAAAAPDPAPPWFTRLWPMVA